MAAVAATAALLATLNRRGLSPERSQVVTAGAATMPVLRPLLLAPPPHPNDYYPTRYNRRWPARSNKPAPACRPRSVLH